MPVVMPLETTVANPAAIRARPPAPKVGPTTGLRHLARLAAPADAQAGAERQRLTGAGQSPAARAPSPRAATFSALSALSAAQSYKM